MVSVAELLNPEPPRAALPSSRPSALRSPPAGRPTAFRNEASTAAATRPPIEMLRMTENARGHSRSKTKGVVNYPPFEALDEASLVQVRRFQVHPFGSIQDTSERIPYNSGKKDFFSKTGREGFEVFRYDFRYKEKPEDDDITYTVMWDYNVGFVRMTPFFRCRGFPKTAPAKMLNSNPGLKEITHGITGGSIKAQGYWMPYSCAKAVCATFCAKIAGALIPLFGPRFPYECIPEGAPGYDRMLISQDIVNRARREAAALFGPRPALLSPRPSRSLSPQRPTTTTTTRIPEPAYADHDRRLLLSPYTDTTDTEYHYHPVSEPYYTRRMCPPAPRTTTRPAAAAIPPPPPTSAPIPQDSPTWAAHNRLPPSHPPPPPPPQYPAGPAYHHRDISQLNEDLLGLNVSSTAHPWLSAVPRSPTPGRLLHHHHPCYSHLHHHQQTSPPTSTTSSTSSTREWNINLPPLRLKRRYEDQVDHPDVAGRENTSINTTNTTNRDTGGGSGGEAERRRSSHSSSRSSSPPSSTTTTVPDTPSTTTGTYHHPSWASGQHHPHHYQQHHQQDDDNHTSSSPPRTPPESTTTATATATTTSSERTNSESTAPLPAETTTAKSGGGGARPAAERDAAIMLMQMRADSEKEEGGSSDGSSTSSTPSNSPGFLRGGRDGVRDREDREARGRDSASPPVLALHHRHHRYRHRRDEADDGEEGETTSSGRSTTTTTTTTTPPPTTTTTRTAAAGGGAGGGSGVEGDSINVRLVQTGGGDKRKEKETEMERIVAARPTPSTPTPGSGPNTRAKRRRTSFGC
ncbi:uncharacterized protein B0T15DRAFT_502015 [Chaetomium strumarium]|uniref:HTH APSES-type domain-containing protein n=1 Tax=Chaetomium strumarium TaxID=1170767 RepID=A0AAJ0GWR2_9PEZI|nr:hypothetical protein B0T15DRAFT_502015 [Chaetomium strumarium]